MATLVPLSEWNPPGDYCPRCAQPHPSDSRLPCGFCWDGTPNDEMFDTFLAITSEDSQVAEFTDARRFLGRITASERGQQLAALAMGHPDEVLRLNCAKSLGWMSDPTLAPVIAPLLQSADRPVREAAIQALALSGGTAAADILAYWLEASEHDDSAEVARALAWLDDQRGVSVAITEALTELDRGGPHYDRQGLWAAVRLGSDEQIAALADHVVEMASSDGLVGFAPAAAHSLAVTVYHQRPALWDRIIARLGRLAPSFPGPGAVAATEAKPRVTGVPRRALTLTSVVPNARADRPLTKFGGQPDWRTEPSWPVDEEGRPLVFCGQVELLEPEARTAYLFMEHGSGEEYEPLGRSNALVIQPGPLPDHLPCVMLERGPQLYVVDRRDSFVQIAVTAKAPESWAVPESSFDPPADERLEETGPDDSDVAGRWNKVGGLPDYYHDEELPPGEGWTFVFQFGSQYVGDESNMANMYGFVDQDGRGALLGQYA